MSSPPEVEYLSTAQMVEVDRAMVEDLGIELVQMMENAGRHLAHLARTRFLDGNPGGRRVAVLAGTGGNGGGALVCARRLHGWGAEVWVVVTAEDAAFSPVPAHQLAIVRRMGIPVTRVGDPGVVNPDLIVDGIIGYSLRGAPRGDAADLIRWANQDPAPVLSLDVPSGLESTTGFVHEPTVVAAATMTLALPKSGLRAAPAAPYVGEVYLADIGVPPALYAGALGLRIGQLFAREEILRLG